MTQALTLTLYITAFISLIGIMLLSALHTAFSRLHPEHIQEAFDRMGKGFLYRPIHRFLFPKNENEGITFVTITALTIARFCFTVSAFFILLQYTQTQAGVVLEVIVLIFVLFVIGDFLPRIIATKYPLETLKSCSALSLPYLLIAVPFSYPFLKLASRLSSTAYFEHFLERPETEVEQEIMGIVREAHLETLEPDERKWIMSVLSFRERIVREIMIPRVNVFSLPEEMSIKEAAHLLEEEGYSRVPVYRETVDNIVGVLMHKDIAKKYAEYSEKGNDSNVLEAPISSLQKTPLYTPETKKISQLLQEFRKKQVHMAIVVDEYGGTEGIVTIEDVLEEIVGEIADEYDIEEEQFIKLPDHSWIVDAQMNINDAEEQLGIKIPQTGEYDTVGGYIFHRTGTIPSKGFVIHHDDFELEILRSNERCVEKVRIRPIKSH